MKVQVKKYKLYFFPMIYLLCTNFRGYNSTIGTFNLAWSGDVSESRRHARTRHMWPGTSGRIGAGAYPHTHSWHPRILDLKNMPGAENWHLRTSLALKSHTNTRKILSCCTNNWCGNCWLIKFSLWIKRIFTIFVQFCDKNCSVTTRPIN